ncbi:MAG: hypothetical protein JNM94_15095 [Phycisphaerae bacterium]|nr:hypothetical protein [Phycisphaerae bacterium]
MLDVLYAQWRALGVPFNASLPAKRLEAIDPEALIWCSLEFLESEPRLAEGVRAWLAANSGSVIRQRLNTFAKAADARSDIWRSLDAGKGTRASPRQAVGSRKTTRQIESTKPLGRRAPGTATIFLRARDILGNDLRSFLIVYLVGSPRGIRLRLVQEWTGYSYRSISEAAVSWERAGVVSIQHGHCILANSAPWRDLLDCRSGDVIVVDWPAAYGTSIELLRTLRKAREKGFDESHTLVRSAIAATAASLVTAAAGADDATSCCIAHLRMAVSRD